ncbi:hypothetical protein VYU27_008686 [Nannochloropsis oceanica]
MLLSYSSSTRRKRRRGRAGGRRPLSLSLTLLPCLLLLLPSTTALHAVADSPLVAAMEGGMEGGLEGGGAEEWEHAVRVMRMEMNAWWSLAWGSLWGKGGKEGGRGKERAKEGVSLTYTASSSSPLALFEEEEKEDGWQDGDEGDGGEGLVWREVEGEEGERREGRWVHRGEEDEEGEEEEGDEWEEEAQLWRIGDEDKEEEEEEGYLSHFGQLYADEDKAEDEQSREEVREEGMATAAPADSPPSSAAIPAGPPSPSLLFLSALSSLSRPGSWRLYLVLFLALVLVLSTSLVVAYLSLARLLGVSPLEGWERGGKEGGRNRHEVFLRPEGEGPPIVDPSISPWPVYSGLLGYLFGGGFGENKFVRFSSWQTEDDGEGGGVKRVPFEAYEAITYEEGIEAEDEAEDEGEDEDGLDLDYPSDDEDEGGEWRQESLWRKRKEAEEEKEGEGKRERCRRSTLEGREREDEREAVVWRSEKVMDLDGVTGAGGNGGREAARSVAS